MELNMDDSPPVTPKARRRSSFLERRTSAIMPVIPDVASNVDLAKQEEELKQKNIELYMDLLNKEKTAWEDCYRNYKNSYKESKQRLKSTSNSAPLLPEHLAFLSQRPNLAQLAEDVSSLTGTVSSLLALQRRHEAAWLRVVQAELKRGAPMMEAILERSGNAWHED